MAWEERLLSHCRNVHFSLVGAAVALIIAASLRPPDSLVGAYQEAQTVDRIATRNFTTKMADRITKATSFDVLMSPAEFEVLPGAGRKIAFIEDEFIWRLGDGRTLQIGSWQWGTSIHWTSAPFRRLIFTDSPSLLGIENLKGFEVAWDFLAAAYGGTIAGFDKERIEWFSAGRLIKGKPAPRVSASDLGSGGADELIGVTVGFLNLSNPEQRMSPPDWRMVVSINPDGDTEGLGFSEFHIPIKLDLSGGSRGVQSVVVPFQDAEIANGPARNVFGDLFQAARGLETLEFDQLLKNLRSRRDESEGEISILGVSVPLSLVGQWGVGILLLIQVYFLLHINKLKSLTISRTELDTYPWIGVYQDKWSRIAYLSSVTILPVFAGALMTWPVTKVWNASASQSALLMMAGLSFVVTVRIGYLCWRVAEPEISKQPVADHEDN